MTHFPPIRKTDIQSEHTSHPMYDYQSESRQKYFSNDFTENNLKLMNITEQELYQNIKVWISGHTHYSYDFKFTPLKI